ncbi:DUF2239 family protein [Paludisphaera borealis]|uniref:DUF2239 domain-containing protein n=1 Tax=Paludisphaera borealis TaxID=1387353 RepID=A0A1U7CPI2_9BACT|nr:DUF2239 family protein [Paludisphaera borealis]APW60818.1 hypothetical protein BSF38_02309 [Paludisphaera borealis]
MDGERRLCTAFEGDQRIARGLLIDVAVEVKRVVDRGESAPVLIFDDETSEQVEIDLRGTVDDVLKRFERSTEAADDAPRGPGRPRLGVVSREVTLLPRHWEWLGDQPGGASVTLRKIVDEARRANEGKDRVRKAQEAAYRFLSTMGGNLPGFEEANRALFAGDADRFAREVALWPADVREHATNLALAAFQPTNR